MFSLRNAAVIQCAEIRSLSKRSADSGAAGRLHKRREIAQHAIITRLRHMDELLIGADNIWSVDDLGPGADRQHRTDSPQPVLPDLPIPHVKNDGAIIRDLSALYIAKVEADSGQSGIGCSCGVRGNPARYEKNGDSHRCTVFHVLVTHTPDDPNGIRFAGAHRIAAELAERMKAHLRIPVPLIDVWLHINRYSGAWKHGIRRMPMRWRAIWGDWKLVMFRPRFAGVIVAGALVLTGARVTSAAPAADQNAQVQIPLAGDVVPAPDGFVAVGPKYVTTRATDLYISPFLWAGKVRDIHLAAGQAVEVLGQPKGYDWLLIGKNGTGVGYLPRSVLAEAQR